MSVRVKPGDFVNLAVWAIGTQTVRALLSFVPTDAHYQSATGDPYNLEVKVAGSGTRAISTAQVTIKEYGVIESTFCTTIDGTAPTGPGECYTNLSVNRGSSAAFTMLTAGYLHSGKAISYPTDPCRSSREGPGRRVVNVLPQPAVGADYAVVTVPTAALWRVRGFFGTLTAANAGSARLVTVPESDSGGNEISRGIPNGTQAINTVVTYSGGRASLPGSLGAGMVARVDFPDVLLQAGDTVSPTTVNKNAGDQWTAGTLTVEEWIRT